MLLHNSFWYIGSFIERERDYTIVLRAIDANQTSFFLKGIPGCLCILIYSNSRINELDLSFQNYTYQDSFDLSETIADRAKR